MHLRVMGGVMSTQRARRAGGGDGGGDKVMILRLLFCFGVWSASFRSPVRNGGWVTFPACRMAQGYYPWFTVIFRTVAP